jgi:hypothetical protein
MIAAAVPSLSAAASRSEGKPPSAGLVDQWISTLRTLPVGWDNGRAGPRLDSVAALATYLMFLVGLVVTASSAVFGAPFWFDLLQRLIQIRSTGAKPADARPQAASSGAAAAGR